MGKFHQLEFLQPRDFLSFGPDFPGVELGPLNVLVGANGSGKSNFLEAARFLHEAPKGLRGFLTNGGSRVGDWCFQGAALAVVRARVSGPRQRVPLGYQLGLRNTDDVVLAEERLREEPHGRSAKVPRPLLGGTPNGYALKRRRGADRLIPGSQLRRELPVIEQVRDPGQYPEVDWLRGHLAGYSFYGEAHFGRYGNELRHAQSAAQPERTLLESGRNLALVLNGSLNRSTEFRDALLEHVQEVYPFVGSIGTDITMGQVQVVFTEKGRTDATPAARLSDGTMRWLFLGALLLDDRVTTPLFLEEPELALHPDAIIPLARLLKRASQHRQVIVTTHSDALLAEFTDTPEVVLVFDRDERGSSVRRLASDDAELKAWFADGHSLAEVWRSGVVGGNRW